MTGYLAVSMTIDWLDENLAVRNTTLVDVGKSLKNEYCILPSGTVQEKKVLFFDSFFTKRVLLSIYVYM